MSFPEDISRRAVQRARSQGSIHSESPVAQAAIARDLEEESEYDLERGRSNVDGEDPSSDSDGSTLRPSRSAQSYGHSMVGSYRRPSFTAGGPRATVGTGLRRSSRQPTKSERHEARREERSLLRDNNVIPPKHPQKGRDSKSLGRRVSQILPSIGIPGGDRKVMIPGKKVAETTSDPSAGTTETTPLLGDPELPYGGQDSPTTLNKKWESAVMEGKIKTTWQREAKVIGRYSAPLILTFLLQYSLTVASIFTVGHLGKVELGAVSLASMTSNITGYAIYQGLATSLDTLCSQAYGSGHKKLVGLQMQRMVYFLFVITIPIGVIWLSAGRILESIVPEKDVARKECNPPFQFVVIDCVLRARRSISQNHLDRRSRLCFVREWKAISSSAGPVLCFSLRPLDMCSSECSDELAICLGNLPSTDLLLSVSKSLT